jgi:L-fuconolactonase
MNDIIIDSHIHFWDLNNKMNSWVLNQPRSELHRNYLPWANDKYKFIHIEAHDSKVSTLIEIQWLAKLMNQVNGIYKHIAFADITQSPLSFAATIDSLKPFAQVVGIRHILAHNQDCQYSPCALDLSSNSNIGDNLHYLASKKLIFNCQIFPEQLDHIIDSIKSSKVTTIIDHMFLPIWQNINDSVAKVWIRALDKISLLPNVYLKLSGLDMLQPQGRFNNIVKQCLNHFPVDRMLYGSNFPVSCNNDYTYWYEYLKTIITLPEEQNKLFYANACSLFFKD